jgi:hypothetical protein
VEEDASKPSDESNNNPIESAANSSFLSSQKGMKNMLSYMI